jgi:hypothetical protein
VYPSQRQAKQHAQVIAPGDCPAGGASPRPRAGYITGEDDCSCVTAGTVRHQPLPSSGWIDGPTSTSRDPVSEAVEGRPMGADPSKESKPESGSDIDSPPASEMSLVRTEARTLIRQRRTSGKPKRKAASYPHRQRRIWSATRGSGALVPITLSMPTSFQASSGARSSVTARASSRVRAVSTS